MSTTATSAPALWLGEAQCKAAGRLAAEPDPSAALETWRRTDFKSFGLDKFSASSSSVPSLSIEGAESAPKEVIVCDLQTAAERHPDLVRPHLAVEENAEYRKLHLANAAGWRGGAFVYVPRGTRVPLPIKLSYSAGDGFSLPRALVVVEPEAEVSVWEEHLSPSPLPSPHRGEGVGEGVSIGVSTLIVGEGARVNYFYTQELGDVRSFWTQKAKVGDGAQLTHTSVVLGGSLHKSFLDVDMSGRGGRSELYGILLGSGEQHFDSHTFQHQSASRTFSDLLFRAALKDRARSVYTGLIRLEPGAGDSDAFQANHNLLLSSEARADSTPVLEILTDSVRCKHGATAGPISKDELFYLAARGIPAEEAQRMLIMGFFEPVLKRLPLEAARERLARRIEASL